MMNPGCRVEASLNLCYPYKLQVKDFEILIYSEVKNVKPKSTGYNILPFTNRLHKNDYVDINE